MQACDLRISKVQVQGHEDFDEWTEEDHPLH